MTPEPSPEAEKLLPCPFCGSEALLQKYDKQNFGADEFYVICPPCDLIRDQAWGCATEAAAIAAWNHRLSSTPAAAEPVAQIVAWLRERADADDIECDEGSAETASWLAWRIERGDWRSTAAHPPGSVAEGDVAVGFQNAITGYDTDTISTDGKEALLAFVSYHRHTITAALAKPEQEGS